MTNCDCPHPPESHAPLKSFATAMCLEHDCDCEGPPVANLPMSPVADTLVRAIARSLTEHPERTPEDAARNITQWLILEFDVRLR